jgi:hypothetical protein
MTKRVTAWPYMGGSRNIKPLGPIREAITQAVIQHKHEFITWCRHNRKQLGSMAGPQLRATLNARMADFGKGWF